MRVVLLFYLMPAWVVVLAWLLGERPSAGSLTRMALAMTGGAWCLKVEGQPWPWPQSLADGLALAGGFCFALTNIQLRRLRDTPTTSSMLAMFTGVLPGPAGCPGRRGTGPHPCLAGAGLELGAGRVAMSGFFRWATWGCSTSRAATRHHHLHRHAGRGGICQRVVRGSGRRGGDRAGAGGRSTDPVGLVLAARLGG